MKQSGLFSSLVAWALTTMVCYVFSDDYKLKPLPDLESFISTHSHLPEIPSANEMQEDGVDINEMQIKLLQKIEELTLYIIEQDKQIKALQETVEKLSK